LYDGVTKSKNSFDEYLSPSTNISKPQQTTNSIVYSSTVSSQQSFPSPTQTYQQQTIASPIVQQSQMQQQNIPATMVYAKNVASNNQKTLTNS
jgi:hypothetical protein